MEERHKLSEPRPCPTATEHNLAWEVDVYRENVPDPIETLRIDDETLPPRLRKGKVVWRLPSDPGKLPSFGTDERRRIMELFKEKKKSRRKKKQDKTLHRVSSVASDTSTDKLEIEGIASKGTPQKDRGKGKNEKEKFDKIGTKQCAESGKEKKKIKNSKKGISTHKGNNDTTDNDKCNGNTSKETTIIDKAQNPPEITKDLDQQISPPMNDTENNGPPGFSPSSSTQQPQIPTRLSINIPCSSDPSEKPTTVAAKSFISLYYPSVTHGLTQDLCRYYNENSQKSISVGGAHSVVIGLEAIAMQITSLSGCRFNVRGVVAQDSVNGGAHLLITGVCTPKGGYVTAFAHSVGLARISEDNDDIEANENSGESGHRYVIQNDALSLLNGEMAVAVEQQQQQQQLQQMEQHRKHMQHRDTMIEEKSNNHIYQETGQGPTLLKPPGLFE